MERLNYFQGMLLTAAEFETEQKYFLAKQRRHNRYLHGWGVVSGFLVSMRDCEIHVTPGVAIDCAGNEVQLESPATCQIPKGLPKFYVVATYIETKVRPEPSLQEEGGDTVSTQEFTRIREACEISIVERDPASGHAEMGPGTSGCGAWHPVPIAHIEQGPKGWKLNQKGRHQNKGKIVL